MTSYFKDGTGKNPTEAIQFLIKQTKGLFISIDNKSYPIPSDLVY